ncbi:3'-5' exoribonuclease YhaM family protein [Tundrisphaera lichenicola]|uniref:3'-5' exoribonuclease YhaM family protein n=1 Tax=Tundrisphaera lichenicola TaxID=2029860 RepID=UPI003EBB3C52
MAGTDTAIVRLSDLEDGQEGEFFAALVKTDRGTDKHGNPYYKCHFRDKRATRVAPIWSSDPLLPFAAEWIPFEGFRIRAKAEDSKFGPQIKIIECRQVVPEDEADGYDFFDLVESSKYPPGSCYARILGFVEQHIRRPELARLVREILDENSELFQKMPAAQSLHHGFSGGLVEHIWSVTRVCTLLLRHYGEYYDNLNPPLDRDVVVAAAILHDIGKLRELAYHPVEAKYTKHGTLIGHIVLGRDMIRDKAREIGDFPEETLMLLEHAILAHHGRMEYGAPKEPATLEALIVHYADEIDAKMNAVVGERMRSTTQEEFTGKIFAVDNRRFYKGIPVEAPPVDDLDHLA